MQLLVPWTAATSLSTGQCVLGATFVAGWPLLAAPLLPCRPTTASPLPAHPPSFPLPCLRSKPRDKEVAMPHGTAVPSQRTMQASCLARLRGCRCWLQMQRLPRGHPPAQAQCCRPPCCAACSIASRRSRRWTHQPAGRPGTPSKRMSSRRQHSRSRCSMTRQRARVMTTRTAFRSSPS